MKNYRIKVYTFESGEKWYYVQRQYRFLWWYYWNTLYDWVPNCRTEMMEDRACAYATEEEALEVIKNQHEHERLAIQQTIVSSEILEQ